MITLLPTCSACADGNHNACLAMWVAVADGAYSVAVEAACGCTICWGRAR